MFLRERIKAIKSELGEDDESEAQIFMRKTSEKKYPKEAVEKLRKEIQKCQNGRLS